MTSEAKGRRRTPPRPATIEKAEAKDLLDLYIGELSRTPVLSAQAQKDLARRMRNSALPARERQRAREDLIRANLRFAFATAKKYQNRGLALEDLVSEANTGLCRAADKYDPDVGVNFISYAVWWIKQALHHALATKARSVRLPPSRAADLTRIARAQAHLREALGHEPTAEQIARVLRIPTDIVTSLITLMAPERSLDEPAGNAAKGRGDRLTLANLVQPETGSDADEVMLALESESRRKALLRALDALPARDRKILVLYYGLESGQPMTLNEISQIFGVTRERVRQLRDRSLARLRSGGAADILRREWAA